MVVVAGNASADRIRSLARAQTEPAPSTHPPQQRDLMVDAGERALSFFDGLADPRELAVWGAWRAGRA